MLTAGEDIFSSKISLSPNFFLPSEIALSFSGSVGSGRLHLVCGSSIEVYTVNIFQPYIHRKATRIELMDDPVNNSVAGQSSRFSMDFKLKNIY